GSTAGDSGATAVTASGGHERCSASRLGTGGLTRRSAREYLADERSIVRRGGGCEKVACAQCRARRERRYSSGPRTTRDVRRRILPARRHAVVLLARSIRGIARVIRWLRSCAVSFQTRL